MERQKGTKTKETVANQPLRSPYLLFILLSFLFSSLHKPLFSLRFKRAMEWERISAADASAAGNYDVFGGFVDVIRVQVMTEEQIEVLRGQISAYSVISEQLVEMLHKTTSTKHLDSLSLSGMVKMSSLHSDPLMAAGGSKPSKLSGRQRWSPTPTQLQILESLFYQGNGTPSKKRIKEIAFELSQHGPIAETNVYNWFQNRRARLKRKKTATAARKNAEFGAEGESPSERKVKSNVMLPPALADAMQSPADVSSELRVIDQDLQFCGCSNEMMVLPNSLSDPAFDHFMTSVETQGTSGVSCWSGETFH